ncbi:MAG TPA: helicase-related protein [Planctomycetaceae bacterium]|jgi:superfamily II DNA or RNA helicase
MSLPAVIDNADHRLADALNELLGQCAGSPIDIATAYFAISGYRLVREKLHQTGVVRLLIGSSPETGADIGMRPRPHPGPLPEGEGENRRLKARLRGDLETEAFTAETLRVVEELIGFLRSDKMEVRVYNKGFLHAKAYLFHRDQIGPHNRSDRLQPYAAIVGSSNFTGPGLVSNRELNIVHRVVLPDEEAYDLEAARGVAYIQPAKRRETLLDPSGVDVPDTARRFIKSEVGARAVIDLRQWFERHWADSVHFKDELIELLDASKFGGKEYSPYEVYTKALYEYFQDELGRDSLEFGRSAVDLAEFQADAARKARRILARYDGVLIADSVGLGKTWIGKKLLEDFAYHRRQKAVVVCPASLRNMWQAELQSATISAAVVSMEEMGRETFDSREYGDADVLLIDESHNFRNGKSNRYLALDQLIQRNGGRGRDGERKKVILLSATPINNDIYDLGNQLKLFTQNQADYFREAGIGDLAGYLRRARSQAKQQGTSAGVLLFNLLEEIMVRNTRPYIRMAYPSATINGKQVMFPDRQLQTVTYDLGATYDTVYADIVDSIERLSLAPYKLEAYRKKETIRDKQEHGFEEGRETALVGIFKTRFLKRLESSIAAFRESVRRGLTFEETYLDYLLGGTVVSSRDFQKAIRYLARDDEDEPAAGSLADDIDGVAEAKAYIDALPKVDLNQYDLRKLRNEVEADVALLKDLYQRTADLARNDEKLEALKKLLAGPLKGRKVLIFSTYKDTARYVEKRLTGPDCAEWRTAAGGPRIRRLDSGNHPDERTAVLGLFAPIANKQDVPESDQIDILISTDVLSEGQNLQDCGVIVNYDLTWNPIRLVQRNGRIDRLGSPHASIEIHNMFPEAELEQLLHLVERLTARISQIDDLGLLDASVLGEIVHPRTFNVLRRLRDGDTAILDEEEARAELAGPELLLQQLKDLLNREGTDRLTELPNGIHSGLRREKCYGMFFYFQAPRADGQGKRHFWRYIDARTHEVNENRFEIAQRIACQPDEPRYIGDQDVFVLQQRVIDQVLAMEREVAAKAVAANAVDPIQQTVAEEIKNAIRRAKVDREAAKRGITFLGQPMGASLHKKLRAANDTWKQTRDDAKLVQEVAELADEFSKERPTLDSSQRIQASDLELICFEYVTG